LVRAAPEPTDAGDGEELPKEDSHPLARPTSRPGKAKKVKRVKVKPVAKHEDVAWWRKVKTLLDEGKSQTEIALILGISQSVVSRIKATWEGRDGC